MTADQPPAKAILADREWHETICQLSVLMHNDDEASSQPYDACWAKLNADRAALRAKLAERDRLLEELGEAASRVMLDAMSRLHASESVWLVANEPMEQMFQVLASDKYRAYCAALEGGPRDG